jgi:hypothetical protein
MVRVEAALSALIQIEAPKPGIRENTATWSKFAHAFTIAVDEYYYRHLNRRIKR